MEDLERSMIGLLTPLLGRWSGEGQGQFPTIKPFRYREQFRFELDRERPLVHYEQRAIHNELGSGDWVESHWESGFLRPLGDDIVEMTNAQDGGRLEIIRFRVIKTPGGLRMEGDSTALINDPRLVATRRIFELHGAVLTYQMRMVTTRVPEGHVHLSATLTRIERERETLPGARE